MQIPGLGEVVKDEDLGWYFGPPMPIRVVGGKKCTVVIDGYDDDDEPGDFHEAITNFLALDESALKQAEHFVFQYYLDSATAAGRPSTIASPTDVWRHVQFGSEPTVKRRSRGDKAVYVSIECNCDWEVEHGLQLVFKNGRVVSKVGSFDGHLTNSDAFADPSLEDVVYVDRETLQRRIAARRKGAKKR